MGQGADAVEAALAPTFGGADVIEVQDLQAREGGCEAGEQEGCEDWD